MRASRSGRTSAEDGVPGGFRVLLLEDGAETSVVLDEDVTGAVLVDPVVIEEVVLLLEAAVDVEVPDVLIVLVEELPATVVVESVLASEEDVLLELDVVVELVVAGVVLVDDVA